MDAISQIISNPTDFFIAAIVIFTAIKEGHGVFLWIKERIDNYHKDKKEDEDFQKQVSDMTKDTETHAESLKSINKSLDELNKRFEKSKEELNKKVKEITESVENERKLDIKATGRILIYQFYEKLKDKNEITAGELEAFNAIADRFIEAGGNGVFKNKIIPEIRNKEVEGR